MKNIQRILSSENIIRVAIIIFAATLLYLFPALTNNVNENLFNTIRNISGYSEADTNIVLINITEEDIESLGGWPVKRSYYA